jgi:hypothetical protein
MNRNVDVIKKLPSIASALLFAMAVVFSFAPTNAEATKNVCLLFGADVSPSVITLGESVTLSTEIYNRCKTPETYSVYFYVFNSCLPNGQARILTDQKNRFFGYSTTPYSTTYTPTCKGEWSFFILTVEHTGRIGYYRETVFNVQ